MKWRRTRTEIRWRIMTTEEGLGKEGNEEQSRRRVWENRRRRRTRRQETLSIGFGTMLSSYSYSGQKNGGSQLLKQKA